MEEENKVTRKDIAASRGILFDSKAKGAGQCSPGSGYQKNFRDNFDAVPKEWRFI